MHEFKSTYRVFAKFYLGHLKTLDITLFKICTYKKEICPAKPRFIHK